MHDAELQCQLDAKLKLPTQINPTDDTPTRTDPCAARDFRKASDIAAPFASSSASRPLLRKSHSNDTGHFKCK